MRAPGDVSLTDLPDPSPGPGERLVRPVAAGVCGTDLELVDGLVDPAYVRYPLTLGHEWSGRLVGGPDDGAPVVVEGVVPDLTCEACARGATNLCATYDEIGFTRPGALADLVAVPGHLVHRLEPGVDPEVGALVEPMAVAWRALTRANPRPGARVLVVGDGTVALLVAHLARALDPESVTLVGARAAQSGLVERAGADRFALEPPDERFDLVVEAAGQPAAVEAALGAAARGATVVLLGLPPHGTRVALAPDDVVNDDLTVQGSFSYTRGAWADVVALVNRGAVDPSFLVTHRFGLDDWERALSTLRAARADEPRGKVMVRVA